MYTTDAQDDWAAGGGPEHRAETPFELPGVTVAAAVPVVVDREQASGDDEQQADSTRRGFRRARLAPSHAGDPPPPPRISAERLDALLTRNDAPQPPRSEHLVDVLSDDAVVSRLTPVPRPPRRGGAVCHARIGGGGGVRLPAAALEAAGLWEGDTVRITGDGAGALRIEFVEDPLGGFAGSLTGAFERRGHGDGWG